MRCSAALLLLQLRATVYGQMKMQKDAFMPGMGSEAEEDDIFERRKLARMQSMQEMAGFHKKTEYGSKKQVEVRLDGAGWGRFKDGDKFLQENANRDGVVALRNGLQYKIVEDGDGTVNPDVGATVEFHVEGRTVQEYLINSTGDNYFDSTRPWFRLTQEHILYDPNRKDNHDGYGIAWKDQALGMMAVGDRWQWFVSPAVYRHIEIRWSRGANAHPNASKTYKVRLGDTVVFDFEVVDIRGPTKPRSDPPLFAELQNSSDFTQFLSANQGKTMCVALLRQPLGSNLYYAFLSASRKLARSEEAAAAVSAEGKYDHVHKNYTESTLETRLGISGPAVIVTRSDGEMWDQCELPRSGDIREMRVAIMDCVAHSAYKELNVTRGANETEVKKAYKRLALTMHPDKGGDASRFHSITLAYNSLMAEFKGERVNDVELKTEL